MNWLARRFELSRHGDGQNLRPMEGLRGWAVFLVFLVHYSTLAHPWVEGHAALAQWSAALHTIGNTGVDLFFVLSGYLIYGSLLGRRQRFGKFMWRRVQRIYPAFLAVFAVYLGASLLSPANSRIPQALPQALLYLGQNLLLLPGLFPIEPMITVAWSLSYEMFYYLALPAVIGVLGLRHRDPRWRCVFFLLLTAAVPVACNLLGGGPIRLTMFMAGILLHEALPQSRIPTPGSVLGVLGLLVGMTAPLLPSPNSVTYALKVLTVYAGFFVLCLACFRDAAAPLPRLLCWTPLRWLGNMSYSYYLVHGLALKLGFLVLAKLLPPTGQEAWVYAGLMLPMFAVTLPVSALLFLAVERPFSLAPAQPAPRCPTSAEVAAAALRETAALASTCTVRRPARDGAAEGAAARGATRVE
ncbi:acyltransferase [uncultured Azohydromonas sp.]|jgi:Predicted acyltransferases|uniref:acyltransferase family protein n=1 Tax=uncultured Azohydromonas sp. TaxID=487342 RepID=UPI00260CF0D3|nr:acyltransferase [uncultured Azohydromonas sp.]